MWDLSFSALNEDSGFWPRLQRRCYGGFRRLSGLSQRFWLSRAYFPFLLWVALGFAALRQPVYGAMALLGICIWLLVFCRDLLASVMPFLLVFLLSTQRYESLGDFLPCAVLAGWDAAPRGCCWCRRPPCWGAAGSCPCISCFSR